MSTEQNNGKPAVPPKRNLLNDRRIRLLLSLLGAVIAWMAVTIVVQPGTTTTIYNVPVDFTYDSAAYTSRGLSIVNAEEKTVNLKLSGDGYTIGSLSANDFVVYPDWSSVRDSGEKSLRLQVRSQSTLLTGVSVSIDGDNRHAHAPVDSLEAGRAERPVQLAHVGVSLGPLKSSLKCRQSEGRENGHDNQGHHQLDHGKATT